MTTFDEFFDEMDLYPNHSLAMVDCHYCGEKLHNDNNAMVLCMAGKEPASIGFGWISVMVVGDNDKLKEVPCCDICFNKPETKYAFC